MQHHFSVQLVSLFLAFICIYPIPTIQLPQPTQNHRRQSPCTTTSSSATLDDTNAAIATLASQVVGTPQADCLNPNDNPEDDPFEPVLEITSYGSSSIFTVDFNGDYATCSFVIDQIQELVEECVVLYDDGVERVAGTSSGLWTLYVNP